MRLDIRFRLMSFGPCCTFVDVFELSGFADLCHISWFDYLCHSLVIQYDQPLSLSASLLYTYLHTHPHRYTAHLFGDIVLNQTVQRHHTADFQKHRDGRGLLSTPAVTMVASPWQSPHHSLMMAKVAASWTAALLFTTDLHTTHHVVRQELTFLKCHQVTDEGNRLQFMPPTNPLVCCLCNGRKVWVGGGTNKVTSYNDD